MTSRPSRPPHPPARLPQPALGRVSDTPPVARINLASVTSSIENAHSALLASEKALTGVINVIIGPEPEKPSSDDAPHPNTIFHRLVEANAGLHATIERVNALINRLGSEVQE